MTHIEYLRAHGYVTDGEGKHILCSAWHQTFESRCLNCGYDPRLHDRKPETFSVGEGGRGGRSIAEGGSW